MATLNQETRTIQNPALGALLLWRFSTGFEKSNKIHEPTPIPLLFIILPMLFHEETFLFIKSTLSSSGLRAFAGKFSTSTNAKNDLLLSIQKRALLMRKLTVESLAHAIASKLLMLLPDKGSVIALSVTAPRMGIPTSIRDMYKQSEKLGVWCASLSLHEISIILRIGF